MLRLVDDAYKSESKEALPERRITDMIYFLGQLLDGGRLSDQHIAKLQQLGLRALNYYQSNDE